MPKVADSPGQKCTFRGRRPARASACLTGTRTTASPWEVAEHLAAELCEPERAQHLSSMWLGPVREQESAPISASVSRLAWQAPCLRAIGLRRRRARLTTEGQ